MLRKRSAKLKHPSLCHHLDGKPGGSCTNRSLKGIEDRVLLLHSWHVRCGPEEDDAEHRLARDIYRQYRVLENIVIRIGESQMKLSSLRRRTGSTIVVDEDDSAMEFENEVSFGRGASRCLPRYGRGRHPRVWCLCPNTHGENRGNGGEDRQGPIYEPKEEGEASEVSGREYCGGCISPLNDRLV